MSLRESVSKYSTIIKVYKEFFTRFIFPGRDNWCPFSAKMGSNINMATPARSLPHYPLDNYELLDRYRRESGRVFLTGTQALVRIALRVRSSLGRAGLAHRSQLLERAAEALERLGVIESDPFTDDVSEVSPTG